MKMRGYYFMVQHEQILLINSLLDGKNENIPNIQGQFAYNSPKSAFTKLGFLLVFKFS